MSVRFFERLLARFEREREVDRSVSTETWMSNEIVECHKMDMLCWYIVYGRTGAGKSTYAIMSLAQAAERIGYNVSWDFIDDHLVFSMEDLLMYFKRVEDEGDRDVGVVVDDAGVHFHAYKAFTDKKTVMTLSSVLQLARIYTANIIFTTPNPNFILNMLRAIPDTYFVAIKRTAESTAAAGIYRINFYPPSRLRAKKIISEEYPLKMPFKKRYDVKRAMYLKEQLVIYEQLLKSDSEGGEDGRYTCTSIKE